MGKAPRSAQGNGQGKAQSKEAQNDRRYGQAWFDHLARTRLEKARAANEARHRQAWADVDAMATRRQRAEPQPGQETSAHLCRGTARTPDPSDSDDHPLMAPTHHRALAHGHALPRVRSVARRGPAYLDPLC